MKKLVILVCTLAFAFAFVPGGEAKAESYNYYSPYSYAPAPTTYTYSGSEQELVQYLLKLIAQLQAQIEAKKMSGGSYYYGGGIGIGYHKDTYVVGSPRSGKGGSDDDEPDVSTDSAKSIKSDSAVLRGEVDMNDFEDGEVFFVYGEDEDMIEDVEDDFDSYSDVDEDGDDLQKIRVDSSLDGDEEYEKKVTNLRKNTKYFYQICVGYEDEDDDDVLKCGGVEDFKTGSSGGSSDDEPDATTKSATNIDDDEATLRGDVDMNDFDNGRVFFVYGEDETQVEDIEDDYDTYSDIDEDGDDLQKVLVDNDLDGSDSYTENVTDLNDDTDYFFQICVEFEDDGGDDKLICGGVEEFTTDN